MNDLLHSRIHVSRAAPVVTSRKWKRVKDLWLVGPSFGMAELERGDGDVSWLLRHGLDTNIVQDSAGSLDRI
jgi:hypothetical protein